MSFGKQFENELNKAFKKRTSWLRTIVFQPSPGRPTKFGRKYVDNFIIRLQEISTKAKVHTYFKKDFVNNALPKKTWHVEGHGPDKKKALFNNWYKRRIKNSKYIVYIFFARNKCFYVGRTGNSGTRPTSHFEKHWFQSISRIEIYLIKNESQLPKLECLAMHKHRPTKNKNSASISKYQKKCPICKINKDIMEEMHSIFQFR